MSLLEDIFLRDEADEARELERIIEGDEYDDKPRSDSDNDSVKEDEAEEEKRRVDPTSTKTKRAVKNPRVLLNPARLTGPRGIQVIPEHFKDFNFRGKGHEKEDLDLVLKKLEHWAYRLYPKFQFEDCLKKIETLGKKRPVMVHLHKIRSDQYSSEETVVQKDSSDDEVPVEREEDEFDKLLQQQIELARSTIEPSSAKKVMPEESAFDRLTFSAPKATSSPSISDEQRERMIKSRKLAEERRLARLKNYNNTKTVLHEEASSGSQLDKIIEEISEVQDDVTTMRKHNRSNIIDSSDEESAAVESITVDIHTSGNKERDKLKETHKEISDEDLSDTNELSNDIKVTKSQNKINTYQQMEVINETVDNNSNNSDIEHSTDIQSDDISNNYKETVKPTENELKIVDDNNKIEETTTLVNKINSDEVIEVIESEIQINKNIEPDENIEELNADANNSLVKEQVNDNNHENKSTALNDNLDDLMDVDLTDDF
ncbi:TIMELESS-interacting protein [Battus philenor]|uniref:TIMELESS-interacting protein n=1 Tax=Battus philenor TaxID=42288 RepID=UPI0035CFDDD3